MSRPSSVGEFARRVGHGCVAALEWHDRRPRARATSPRGWAWIVAIAAVFFWMSNPLVFVPNFYFALDDAQYWMKIVVVVTLPWLRLPRVPWPWVMFLGICYLSQLWTIGVFNTDVSNTLYLDITVLAIVAAANCEALVVCCGLALGGVAVMGLSLYAFYEEIPGAVNVFYGGIAGVGTNENILAYTLVLSLAATLATGLPRRGGLRTLWAAVILVHAYGLYVARSGTGFLAGVSLVLAVGAIAAYPSIRDKRRHAVAAWLGGAGGLLVAGLLVTVGLDKDLSTLSGRAPFWVAVIETTLDTEPWIGSGWGAVWEHPWNRAYVNPVVEQIYQRSGYPLSHGHNFFVDPLPELGLLGLTTALLMVGYTVVTVRRSGLYPGSPDPVAGRLVLLSLVALLVSGINEPMLTVPLGWWTFALVVATARQRVLSRKPPAGRHARSAEHPPLPQATVAGQE